MPCVMTSERWRKWQCVVGGFCAMCIAGQFYIIGNVGTYLESYLKERGDYPQEATWLIPSLVTCVFAGGQVGMAVGGYLDRVIGPQLTTLLGTSLLIVGAALTCWTLHVSSVSVLVTFGAVPSVGFGCAYGSVYSALNKHNFHNLGIMYGIVNSGFGGGAVLFNFVISAFVNPENMAPDKVHSQGRHFSQADILNKVPHSMLLLSGLYVVLFPAVVWGLRPPPPPSSSSSSSSQDVDIDVILTDVTALGSRPAEDSLLKGDDCTSYQALR
ncbi:apicoplast pyruvate carrier 1-like [Babylonia areolata]|uniref:apicoplast pyruvate carrier 1-like n=1 Tax=Babylonia areolata TaxID=304850 RepID=UPI003FCF2F20